MFRFSVILLLPVVARGIFLRRYFGSLLVTVCPFYCVFADFQDPRSVSCGEDLPCRSDVCDAYLVESWRLVRHGAVSSSTSVDVVFETNDDSRRRYLADRDEDFYRVDGCFVRPSLRWEEDQRPVRQGLGCGHEYVQCSDTPCLYVGDVFRARLVWVMCNCLSRIAGDVRRYLIDSQLFCVKVYRGGRCLL